MLTFPSKEGMNFSILVHCVASAAVLVHSLAPAFSSNTYVRRTKNMPWLLEEIQTGGCCALDGRRSLSSSFFLAFCQVPATQTPFRIGVLRLASIFQNIILITDKIQALIFSKLLLKPKAPLNLWTVAGQLSQCSAVRHLEN